MQSAQHVRGIFQSSRATSFSVRADIPPTMDQFCVSVTGETRYLLNVID